MDILKEYQTNLAYHFSEVLDEPIAKPYWIYMSLSHKCTYKCKMCEVVKIFQDKEMETEMALKALDEIAAWEWDCSMTFTGGEPFLRKDMLEVLAYSISKGLRTEVVTNGSLITKDLAEQIVSLGLTNVAISLDGATAATHDFVRKEGGFKKVLESLQLLVDAKKRRGSGPQISVWTTIMKENVSELFDVIDVVKPIGVECLVYHPVIAAQCDMQNTSADAPFWIRGEQIETLKSQIAKIVEYEKKNGLVAFLHDPYWWVNYFEGTIEKLNWKCNPYVFINIGPDGYVRSCGPAFGSLHEGSLDHCLNTPDAFTARASMKSCPKPCLQTCWAHPESDSLLEFTDIFIEKVRKSDLKKNKKNEMIASGLNALKKYEKKVILKKG